MDYLNEHLSAARNAASKAAAYLLEKGRPEHENYKPGRELVTEADTDSQEIILDELGRFGIPVQSEEKDCKNCSALRWVIDPLDGTEHYARGSPLYSVAISLVKDSEPVLGVVNAPAFGAEYYAAAGGGAFKNNRKIRVSKTAELERAAVFIHPYRRFVAQGYEGAFLTLHRNITHPRYLASTSIEIAMVAEGAADAIAKAAALDWDVAAGTAILREAGGKLTDFEGNPWSLEKKNLLASNGRIHAELLESTKSRKTAKSRK